MPHACNAATHARKSSMVPYFELRLYKSCGMYPSSETESVGGGSQMVVKPRDFKRGARSVTVWYHVPCFRALSQLNPWIRSSRPLPVGVCTRSPTFRAGGASGETSATRSGVAGTGTPGATVCGGTKPAWFGKGGAPVESAASGGGTTVFDAELLTGAETASMDSHAGGSAVFCFLIS